MLSYTLILLIYSFKHSKRWRHKWGHTYNI